MRRPGLVIGLGLAMLAAPAAAQDDRFSVYFEAGQARLSPQATAILRLVSERYRTSGAGSVVLAGHTDRAGGSEDNVGLSQRRARAVLQFLATAGVPEGVMTTEAFGEFRNAVDTADGVVEAANNRVEIQFGPGSGW